MEDLEATVKQLHDKLKTSEKKFAELQSEVRSKQETVVYQTKPDKAVKKFHDSDDIEEWIENIDSYVARFKSNTEKVDFILNHLDKKPYTEVRFRIDRAKATSSEVFKILRIIYGVKETFTQLQQEFFCRQQEAGETIDDYSYVLINMIIKMEKEHRSSVGNTDDLLKERFAEGLRDVTQRREMRRLNQEQRTLKFFEIRDRAKRWSRDEITKVDEVVTHEANRMDELFETMQEQQQQMQKLSEAIDSQNSHRGNYRGRGRGRYRGRRGRGYYGNNASGSTDQSSPAPREGNDDKEQTTNTDANEPFVCFYCQEPNHLQRDCIKRKRDRRNGSTNYNHSR